MLGEADPSPGVVCGVGALGMTEGLVSGEVFPGFWGGWGWGWGSGEAGVGVGGGQAPVRTGQYGAVSRTPAIVPLIEYGGPAAPCCLSYCSLLPSADPSRPSYNLLTPSSAYIASRSRSYSLLLPLLLFPLTRAPASSADDAGTLLTLLLRHPLAVPGDHGPHVDVRLASW